jgi:hypothetical protein
MIPLADVFCTGLAQIQTKKPPPSIPYWELIKDFFVRAIEKELKMNWQKYFKQEPENYTTEGKINYFAILYFGSEKDEIAILANQLQDLYEETKTGFVSKSIKQNIKSKVFEISKHKELTLGLINGALGVEPRHPLGETLKNILEAIDDQVEEILIAIAENKNGNKLPNSILNLQLQLHTLQNSLDDSYNQLQKYLSPN